MVGWDYQEGRKGDRQATIMRGSEHYIQILKDATTGTFEAIVDKSRQECEQSPLR